ncbi:MAG: hypothetical protein ACR2IF_15710 [Terriglobales bacterium]
MGTQRLTTIRWSATLILLAAFLGLTSLAGAQTYVRCSGTPGPGEYSTIQAALNATPRSGGIITVDGACHENVSIDAYNNLTIQGGTAGGSIVDAGPSDLGAVISLNVSSGVQLKQLTLQGAAGGNTVLVILDSYVSLTDSMVQGAVDSDGIDVYGRSDLSIRRTTIQNNGGNVDGAGLSVADTSSASLAGAGSIVQNNYFGVWVGGNAIVSINNGAQVLNNSLGVMVWGAQLVMNGPAVIRGNTINGIRLLHAIGRLQGNASQQGAIIEQNGGATVCCLVSAGIDATDGSHLDISWGHVANNNAPGIYLQDSSTARIYGGTISGNSGGGVQVTNLSVALLGPQPLNISANPGGDLVCTDFSIAYGDSSGVAKMKCANFKKMAFPYP